VKRDEAERLARDVIHVHRCNVTGCARCYVDLASGRRVSSLDHEILGDEAELLLARYVLAERRVRVARRSAVGRRTGVQRRKRDTRRA